MASQVENLPAVPGGGAARGWAHIGVLEALRERVVDPQVVSGASIGALVGAALAGGKLDVQDIGLMDFHRAALAVQRGVEEVNHRVEEIARLLPVTDTSC